MSESRESELSEGASGEASVVKDAVSASADPTHPAPPPQSEGAPEAKGESSAMKKLTEKVIAHPVGKIAAVILGALLGLAVEAAVDSTGVLGPGIDTVIARQQEGFAHLEARLDALKKVETPAQAQEIAGEISTLVEEQKRLADRTADELRGARTEIEKLKADALSTTGAAGGADVWLGPGEGLTIGKHGNVFTFVRTAYTNSFDDIYINAGGKAERFFLGGKKTYETPEGVWTVVFKQATPRADGRIGFDVVPPSGKGG